MDLQKYIDFSQIMDENQKAIDYTRSEDYLVWYPYGNYKVPRVSKVLDAAIGKRGLINWAARVGYTKMNQIRDSATKVGSAVHEMIESHIKNGTGESDAVLSTYYEFDQREAEQVHNAFMAYIAWENKVKSTTSNFTPIGNEITVSCPWFGGTIDFIVNINGYNYIIDFKTSKQISYEYLLQVSSYAWMINAGYCKEIDHIDGIGILRIDKTYGNYEEYFLNYHDQYQGDLIYQYTRTFWAILNSFYNLNYTSCIFTDTIGNNQYYVEQMSQTTIGEIKHE